MELTVDDEVTREFAKRNNALVNKRRRIERNWQNPDLYGFKKYVEDMRRLIDQAHDYGVEIWGDEYGYVADITLINEKPKEAK